MATLVSLSQRFMPSSNEPDTTLFLGVLGVPAWCGYQRTGLHIYSPDSDGSLCGLASSVFLWMRYPGARTYLDGQLRMTHHLSLQIMKILYFTTVALCTILKEHLHIALDP